MSFSDNRPIGVFDSGVGGLSVLKVLREILPNENFIYVGDTLRVPYGDKEASEIKAYTLECFEKLREENVKGVVLACNTATSYALDEVKEKFDFPTVGVIGAGALETTMVTKNKRVLLLATNATVNSGIYEDSISRIDSKIEVKAEGCPDIVKVVEEGHAEDIIGFSTCKKYIDRYNDYDYDTLILGCTHFALAEENIRKILKEKNKDATIVDPGRSTAIQLKRIFSELRLLSDSGSGEVEYFISGSQDDFKSTASKILRKNVDDLDVKSFITK
ncbi:glutamate racemase [Anaerosphaera aminiphila DSM 21120]|uniref:Glutamate racemase n=1 Tax=Anaerosphaera aminiphila DSM 21120 TaxID=1120995 RepID=A0A1M5Q9A0_9FIRM|nr:glutamate racemase [Anaerosphaera aminiphila]SHH10727.1 glutamate racemase [Anaerosphaera aminiphila DSM 21120]